MLFWPQRACRRRSHGSMRDWCCTQPNGVVLSPDGQTAYITDTGLFRPETRTSPHTIYAYDVVRTECGLCSACACMMVHSSA